MLKSLHRESDYREILQRLSGLEEKSTPRWGKMNAACMLEHCMRVLQIPLGKVLLPETSGFVRWIGMLTRTEMRLFNNGIPRNMPTYKVLKVECEVDFDEAMKNLLRALGTYQELVRNNELPATHQLFGSMEPEDWGFMEYKHINHHLKQFGL
ncbi:DUF1569 domain-containing protein [Chryseobacterium sp. MFBS3-17]|uniref:DUF1569 domain-containing protein n=1 Tax=Chryseobacterium sp. MFBS3-17 TaxID=2886689 RepID=UPI001D0DE4D5|nr:DUF1569 domain-containing protein [Chryseobacterium sp. MFBS3-17]MCC2589807.1 DUF1569 domain-containing protein [Chryseobacterium sp. MFBS3-17]